MKKNDLKEAQKKITKKQVKQWSERRRFVDDDEEDEWCW